MLKFANTKNGGAMAQALKNLKYQPLQGFAEVVNKGTQFIARMITSWNPEFWLRNPVRDTSAVYFNLAGSDTGRKLRNSIINPKKFVAQVKAIAKYERSMEKEGKVPKEFQGLKNSEVDLARLDSDPMYAYHLMKQNGGKTAFYVFKSVDQLQKEMLDFSKQKLTNPANVIRKVSKYVDLINVSLENAYRVRTFTEFLKAGKPIERAIREARNVTVDFNKKGVNSHS